MSAAPAATRAAIALGSNLGDRERSLRDALAALGRIAGVSRVVATSRLRETEPVGGPPQDRFLNGVVAIETTLPPRELLHELLALERAAGRERGPAAVKDGPRTLDLDLLFHGDAVVDEPALRLPHPRLHRREFVLEPLAEVAPDWVHPLLRRTAAELLAELRARPAAREANA